METRGLTGLVKFDRDGFRSDVQFDIVSLNEKGLQKVGTWNSTSSDGIDWMWALDTNGDTIDLKNKTLVVLISLTAPYGIY